MKVLCILIYMLWSYFTITLTDIWLLFFVADSGSICSKSILYQPKFHNSSSKKILTALRKTWTKAKADLLRGSKRAWNWQCQEKRLIRSKSNSRPLVNVFEQSLMRSTRQQITTSNPSQLLPMRERGGGERERGREGVLFVVINI